MFVLVRTIKTLAVEIAFNHDSKVSRGSMILVLLTGIKTFLSRLTDSDLQFSEELSLLPFQL